jgi:serine/threonine protein kinase
MVAPTAPALPIRFGKYQLIERLGRGGMAEVWKAKMLGPAGFVRTLVVKRILPHLAEDPHFVQMFVAEARLSARLNHANIVQVYELGDVAGEYFLAMEYVRGRDLVTVMRQHLQHSVPPPGLGVYATREICRALHYAHTLTDDDGKVLRLIHRDISPSNVMLSFDGAVKLLDFGIAKALNEASEIKTQTGTLKGKFGYMAPEQIDGKDIDHRADLFAAGVTLHEVLTGRRLFKGATDMQTIAMVREAKVSPPSTYVSGIPAELDRICLKALARNVDERYASCGHMAEDLDHVLHELKYGPERAASLMRDLFPNEPSGASAQMDAVQAAAGDDATALPPSDAPAAPASQPSATPPRRRRYELLGLVAFAGAAAAVVVQTRQAAPPPAPIAAPAPPPAPPPPAPPPPVEPSKEVAVRINSTPSGAEVFLDGEPVARGRTPMTLMLPRGDQPHQLSVDAKGYQPHVVEVTPDSDSRLELTLTPRWAVPFKPSPGAAKPPHNHAPKPPAAKPDLKKGDVVDPFAQ